MEASIKRIKTKVWTILKEIFLIRLSTITIWFDQNCPVQYWKRDLCNPLKIENSRLYSNYKIRRFEASIENIKTKVSTILKEIFLIRLTTITIWFDQNCPVQYWKRDLRIPQKLIIPDLIRITKASHLKRQLKVLKRKFERSYTIYCWFVWPQ